MPKPIILIGLIGTVLDSGSGAGRWERWRPTVALCRHKDLPIARYELLFSAKFQKLADVLRADIATVSPETSVQCHDFACNDPWDFEQVYGALHDFARGYAFDTQKYDYLVNITTGTHVAQICLFLLTETRHLPARLIQSGPPPRKQSHLAGTYSIIDLDLSKYNRLASRFQKERTEGASFLKQGIATRNARFNQLIEQLEQVALASKAPLLLMGPTGAGKSRLARRIFELKKSRNLVKGAFAEVNSATLRGDAAMSALFGHVKGAFTGAVTDRPGLLKRADQGVLFLDEIGELGLDEQAMLLRALEEKVFTPLGSDRETHSEFQLIAGTNKDLVHEAAQGRFREDLLARINLWTFRLPGLRERPEDLEPNLDFEFELFEREQGTRVTLTREARVLFLERATAPQARWKANFRDLNGLVTRLATLAQGGRIVPAAVNEEFNKLDAGWAHADQAGGGVATEADAAVEALLSIPRFAKLDTFDQLTLRGVLRVCRDSASLAEAGRKLFEFSRMQKRTQNDADRLRKYLARFGLEFGDAKAE